MYSNQGIVGQQRDSQPEKQLDGFCDSNTLRAGLTECFNSAYFPRSPATIEMALKFWHTHGYNPYDDSDHHRNTIKQFLEVGLIVPNPKAREDFQPLYLPVHEALRIYIDALCAVNYPVQRWVMP
jgi:hypothetical protein